MMVENFAGRSFLKLKAVPNEFPPKEKLQNKLIQYIIILSEKGGILDVVTFPPDSPGTWVSLCNMLFLNLWQSPWQACLL